MRLTRTGICNSTPPPNPRGVLLSAAVDGDDRYYEGGVSSVYMWDLDDGIAGVVLFKKSTSILDPRCC